MSSLEFLLGLAEHPDTAFVAWEDFLGPHAAALRRCQARGWVEQEPLLHPFPSCPCCKEGALYLNGGRCLCNRCFSTVDRRHLLVWKRRPEAFLHWLVGKLGLRDRVRQLDERFWQVGTLATGGLQHECFMRLSGPISAAGRNRLLAYRNALLLRPLPIVEPIDGFRGPCLSLLEIMRQERFSVAVADLAEVLNGGGAIRFDGASGALWAGNRVLGHVPPGGKEYHFLGCLWQRIGQVVPYADIRHHVLQQSGSRDAATDEATFCQKLKSAAKKRIPTIDQVVVATNKGLGYQLRTHLGPTGEP